MRSIYPDDDEDTTNYPRRPWSYWADMQARNLRAALGCDDATFWAIGRTARLLYGDEP